jgi:hypothetical protein
MDLTVANASMADVSIFGYLTIFVLDFFGSRWVLEHGIVR